MISTKKLEEIYKSEKTAQAIAIINHQLLELFLKGLEKNLTLKELARKWSGDWKHVKSEDFILVLDEITRQTLNKIQNLDILSFYWFRTIHPHFRWHLRNSILIKLGIEQTDLNPEQILTLLKAREIKFTLKQIEDLNLIINHPDYQK